MDIDTGLILKLVLSCALGALIGIEREFGKSVGKQVLSIGLRTSILLCMLGFLFGTIHQIVDNILILIFGISVAVAIGLAGYFARLKVYKLIGMTTFTSAIIIFMIGLLISFDKLILAVIVAILTAAFLAYRREMHKAVKALTKKELESAIKFAIIAFVILPLLPNKTIDPWNVFNPFQFWTYVILISAISFITYIAMRLYSEKGVVFSSFLSGIISSTATSFVLIKSWRENKRLANILPSAVLLSIVGGMISYTVIMFLITKSFALLKTVSFVMIVTSIAALLASKCGTSKHKLNLGSPFALRPAVEFACIYLVAMVFVTLAQNKFGVAGSLIIVALGSMVSATGVIAGVSSIFALGQLDLPTAALMISVSVFVNILNKYFWARTPSEQINLKIYGKLALLAAICATAIFIQLFVLNKYI